MHNIGAITLSALQFFIDVYDAQSFSVAARQEGVSASKVSRIIQQLEDTLGQQLFYRNTRSVIPTEAGRLFISYARAMTAQISEAQRELRDRTVEASGMVRINAPVYFGQRHIAPWLPALAERYPRLHIEMTQTDDYVDPHRDAADVLFRIGALTDSSVHARVFSDQHYHLAASAEYISKWGMPARPEEVASHHCLVYQGSSGPNRWLFRQRQGKWLHYPVPARLAANNAETLLRAALGGMGLVLFPDWLIGDSLKSGALIKLLPGFEAAIKAETQHVAAIYPHARHPPLNVRVVIDFFVEAFGTPPYWQQG